MKLLIETVRRSRGPRAALAPLALVVCVGLLAPPAQAKVEKVYGVEMPSWSKKIGEDRFQSPRNWVKTVEFFHDQFKGWKSVETGREVNLPSVKYLHIENKNEKADWAGINLYELPSGKVRIYVLKRIKPPKAAADDNAGKTTEKKKN